MKNFVMLAALAAVAGFALPTNSASAAPRKVCKVERQCSWHHGHKVCKKVTVCRTIGHDHR